MEHSFCKSRPYMAHQANPYEAKCSYVDSLSFIFSPQPVKSIAFYVKSLVFGTSFHEKAVFHSEASRNQFSTKTQALADRERGRRRFLFVEMSPRKHNMTFSLKLRFVPPRRPRSRPTGNGGAGGVAPRLVHAKNYIFF